jgi:dihydrofolate reductase
MRKIIGAAFQSLDGVIQAPGTPVEDPTGGFAHGGWLVQFMDEGVGEAIGRLFDGDFDLLLGRRTYEIFAAYWPFMKEGDDRFISDAFDRAAKYVLTRGDQPLTWANSHRLKDLDAVAALKRTEGPDLVIQGSSTLYPALLAAGLLDRVTLLTFPVLLGAGKRLFGEGTQGQAMRMVEHKVTDGGNIIAAYAPNGELVLGSFGPTEPLSEAEVERRDRMAAGTW